MHYAKIYRAPNFCAQLICGIYLMKNQACKVTAKLNTFARHERAD